MTVSAATAKQLHKVDDAQGLLTLLKITHANWAAPVCLVADTRNLVTLGDTYIGIPFTVTLPNDKAKESPRARLQIDNVGRDLTSVFEQLPAGATLMATLRVVHRSTPTVVDYEFAAPLTGVHTDMGKLTASMGWDDAMRRAAVNIRFDPSTAPGLFPD